MRSTLLLATVLFAYTGYSQTCDCQKYKVGKFQVDNMNGTVSEITRTGKYQTEKLKGVELKDQIQWIDECTYRMIPGKRKDETGIVGNEVLVFKIIETLEHAYIVHATMEGDTDFSVDVKVYEKGYLNYDKK